LSGRAPATQRIALITLVLGACAIGFAPIFVRLSEVGPAATASYRLLIALPVFWLWASLERPTAKGSPRRWSNAGGLVLAGLFYAGDLALWHWSIRYTTVANATLLTNLAPIFVTAGAWLLFRERITRGFLAGLAIALTGTALLVGNA
jgi:drug/metabolite transporter (DMT)-like permease